MAPKKTTEKTTEKTTGTLTIARVETESTEMHLVGLSPIYYNRLAMKAQRELLAPQGRKRTDADRAAGPPKHDPIMEFRNSVHSNPDGRPTRLCFPAPAVKKAMMTAALDLPGVKKAEIARLLWIGGESIDIYGIPYLKMDGVRMSDINHTPDIRTRAFLPEWACKLTVTVVKPKLDIRNVGHLITAAGLTCGIGDFRQEKGAGTYGQFMLVNEDDDSEWADVYRRIISEQDVEAQDAALQAAHPLPTDPDTVELLHWFTEGRDHSAKEAA